MCPAPRASHHRDADRRRSRGRALWRRRAAPVSRPYAHARNVLRVPGGRRDYVTTQKNASASATEALSPRGRSMALAACQYLPPSASSAGAPCSAYGAAPM